MLEPTLIQSLVKRAFYSYDFLVEETEKCTWKVHLYEGPFRKGWAKPPLPKINFQAQF